MDEVLGYLNVALSEAGVKHGDGWGGYSSFHEPANEGKILSGNGDVQEGRPP